MDIVTFFLFFIVCMFVSFVILGVACTLASWSDAAAERDELSAIERERLASSSR